MKKRSALSMLSLVILFFLMPQAILAQALTGNEKVTRSTRKVSGIESIKVSGGIDLYITQGASESLEIEADENIHSNIITEVVSGELRIYNDKSVRKAKELKVYVTIREIKALSASGGSDVETTGMLKLKTLEVKCSGGSDSHLTLQVDELKCSMSGGSDASLTGEVKVFHAYATGGSDLNALELKTAECHIEASGGSDARVYATDKLTIEASGGSDVTYAGTATVDAQMSGSSDLHKK